MKIVGMTAEENRVAVELVGDLKLPDGRDYRNTYHVLLVIRDGRISNVREYLNTAYGQKVFASQPGSPPARSAP